MEFESTLFTQSTWAAYSLIFLGGVVTSIGPCNVAMIPLLVGYVGGTTMPTRGRAFILSLGFAVGLATTFMLLGVIAALLGSAFTGVADWGYYLVAFICFVLGLQMLGALEINLSGGMARLRERINWHGLPGAYVLGLVSGLVASQCATPILLAVLTYVMVQRAAIGYGAALLFVYALGRGVPIVLAGTFAAVLKGLRQTSRWSTVLEAVSGLVMIGMGLYFLWLA
ncbi:MAG: sulfite exporter TauE/SafE family protein [Ardenticatenaceae bacterium]|nr:sulfite exporter TauE/SafE family protein [Ardenticatenaceae bacterium]MCB9444389.1 sulfite exporter TauE/SafE family protein [Ardenticatenaceae bacterium]